MSLTRWFQNLRSALAPGRSQRKHWLHGAPRSAMHRINLEALEDRCVPAYAVTNLGYLTPTDLNNAGQVVGNSGNNAILVNNGTQIYLGSLGGSFSHAAAINDSGQVVGYSAVSGDANIHAFLLTPQGGVWFRDSNLDGRNDLMIDLVAGEATAINNAGQVVGDFAGGAFLWDAVNGMTTLGNGIPTDINDHGQVIGEGGWGSPFLWDAVNGMTFLDTGGFPTFVKAINNGGQIVGSQWYAANPKENAVPWAVEWYGGGFWNLYGASPTLSSNANDINNSGFYGQVVGSVETDIGGIDVVYGSLATVWNPGDGNPQYLQYAMLPGTNVTLYSAELINDNGAIVASGMYSSSYLLTPVRPGVPTVSIADAPAVTEGNADTHAANFTVRLSEASTQTITVDYATGNGSATAGSDYQAANGTLIFAPGETSKAVTLLVNGDRLPEGNESFVVNLSNPTNGIIADGQGTVTILDDEPVVGINYLSKKEGNSGLTAFAFTVSLSAPYDLPVTIGYSTANGTATAGSDYQSASGTLTIPAGQTSGRITVQAIGDRLPEPNETFFVNLGNSNYGVVIGSQGVGTILDDEPRISIGDVSKKEGRTGQTTLFTFTVTLSAASDQAVTMSYRTVDGTASTVNADYVARTGTLTFAPGERTKTITIEVIGDNKKEANETFYLDLFGNSPNSLFTKKRGVGTILNDD